MEAARGDPRAACRTSSSRCSSARRTRSATPTIRTTSCASSSPVPPPEGIDLFRVFDSLNWVENMRVAMDAVLGRAPSARRRSAIPATSSIRRGRSTTSPTTSASPGSSRPPGPTCSGSRTWPACASPRPPGAWSGPARGGRHPDPLPHPRHERRLGGQRPGGGRGRRRRRRRGHRPDERPHLAAQPRRDRRGAPPHRARYRPPARAARPGRQYWEAVRTYYAGFESPMRAGASEVYEHEMPGGQYTNLRQQAKALGSTAGGRRWPGRTPRQRPARRHRQGHADLEGGRRPGACSW